MDELEFQNKCLSSLDEASSAVRKVSDQQRTILSDISRLDKTTKTAFEEIEKLKKVSNDFAVKAAALQRADLALKRETRAAFGDPIQRIAANEEYNWRINAAVRMAIARGSEQPQAHYLRKLKDQFGSDVTRALGEDSSPGSTLITDQLVNELYDTLARYGKWSTLAVRPVSTKTNKLLVKTARPIAVVVDEGGEIPDDANKAGTALDCVAKVIACLLNVSNQVLDDGEIDVAVDVLEDFIEAFNYRLDVLSFSATGAADAYNGSMTGLFNFGTAANSAPGNTAVETLDLDDFIRCLVTVDPAVLTRTPKWWIHPQILARALTVKDGSGRPIFQTALEAPSFGAIGSILGSPVEMVPAAPSANTAGSKVATFGDPRGFVVGMRKQFAFEYSDHHKWNTLQRSFRGTGRAGTKGRVANAFAVLTLAAG